MRFELPPLSALPTVLVALRWLLDSDLEAPADVAVASAEQAGLLHQNEGADWKIDGDLVTKLFEAGLKRVPEDPRFLGQLLHGLGELHARCHATGLYALVSEAVTAQSVQTSIASTFDHAAACEQAIGRGIRSEEVALAQRISSATLNWETFRSAKYILSHSPRVFGGYGLDFVTRIVLRVAPAAVDMWIASHPNNLLCAIIGSAAQDMAIPFRSNTEIRWLLKSGNAAIKCLGAAALLFPVDRGVSVDVRECHRILVEAGFAAGDVVWMTSMRLQEAIFGRNRGEDGHQKNTARLKYIERNPEEAVGSGPGRASHEIEMLQGQIERNTVAYNEVLREIETLLADLVADWPEQGLDMHQLDALDNCFVNAYDLRHRLAAGLPSHVDSNRQWLWNRNVELLCGHIGLNLTADAIPSTYSAPDEAKFMTLSDWTANSAVHLYQATTRGVGRNTSILVHSLWEEACRLMAIPFVSSRNPDRWKSVITRDVCAMRFVFRVVGHVPEDQRSSVIKLNEFALAHTRDILAVGKTPKDADRMVFHLEAEAVCFMECASNPDEHKELWSMDERLPPFPRAFALWSSLALVTSHTKLAFELFEATCDVPVSRGEFDVRLSRMVTLLDAAIATCLEGNNTSLASQVKTVWKQAYQNWLQITPGWQSIAEKLELAISADGSERAEVLATEALANTRCRRLIESKQGGGAPPLNS